MMNLIQRQRMILLAVSSVLVALALGLILFALRQNINLFFTPTQVMHGEAPAKHNFRIGGLVVKQSVKRDDLDVSFQVTDLSNTITIEYHGILPDLFREGQGIVAEGNLGPNGRFRATQVLAKHDENYMPPEVAASLKGKLNNAA